MQLTDPGKSRMTLGAAAAAGAFLVWGMLPAYWKLLGHVAPLQVTAHRTLWSMVAAAGLVLLGRRRRQLWAVLRCPATAGRLVLSAAMLGANWFIFIWGVNHGFVLEASLGYYINPLVSVLLGCVVLRERLRPVQVISVLLALAAVANLLFNYGRFPWIALGLAASFAVYGLIRKTTDVAPIEGLAVEMAVLSIPAAILVGVLHTRGVNTLITGDWATRFLLAGTGVVTAAPLLLFAYGVKRIRLSMVGFLQYIAPSCMFLQGVLLYDEPFTRHHAVTFGLIWIGLAVFSWDSFRHRRGGRSAG